MTLILERLIESVLFCKFTYKVNFARKNIERKMQLHRIDKIVGVIG